MRSKQVHYQKARITNEETTYITPYGPPPVLVSDPFSHIPNQENVVANHHPYLAGCDIEVVAQVRPKLLAVQENSITILGYRDYILKLKRGVDPSLWNLNLERATQDLPVIQLAFPAAEEGWLRCHLVTKHQSMLTMKIVMMIMIL
jgi:hypothetical protein